MIVYVNGDSHSAGAEAVNHHAFAKDDYMYRALGNQPHPDNLQASYGCCISNELGAVLDCDAQSASSNDRIIRTTEEYLKTNRPDLLIIGWATWEREEWLHEGTYWQINAGGIGFDWPDTFKEQYKPWVIEQLEPNVINAKLINWHNKIFQLHQQLLDLKIPHLFFNTYLSFFNIQHLTHLGADKYNWGYNYVDPYNDESNYYQWLKLNNYKTAYPDSYHFKSDAHRAWADFLLLNYINKLT
jgi:hypothetical protein